MTPRRITATVALGLLLVTAEVAADPAPPTTLIQTEKDTRLCHVAEDGAPDPVGCRLLPPGRFLDETSYTALDLEMRRLQDAETRLGAENTSLRKTTTSWQPGWKTVVTVFLVGVSGGVYIHSKL